MKDESTPTFSSAVIAPRADVEKVVLPRRVDQRDAACNFPSRLPTFARNAGVDTGGAYLAPPGPGGGGFKLPPPLRGHGVSHSGKKISFRPTATCQAWTVSDDYHELPDIPMFYPIETTSTVVDCRAPRVVVDRVVKCLRLLSISAEFNPEEASLLAETLKGTLFYVRMYKKSFNGRDGVLVEVQRSRGDVFDFSKHSRAILACARGENTDGNESSREPFSPPSIPDSVRWQARDDAKINRCNDEESAMAVEQVEDLLQKDSHGAFHLGMDSLLLLTDSNKSLASFSAAEAVLKGEGAGNVFLKEFVNELVRCTPPDHNDERTPSSAFNSHREMDTHNIALAVLGNSLQALARQDVYRSELHSVVLSNEWLGPAGIASVLLSELSQAHVRPHDAYQSARCLNAILASSPNAKMTLDEIGLPEVARAAQSVGRQSHFLLEQECDKLVSALKNQ